MYLAESPHDAQVIWIGTDDGLIHVTRNGGNNWNNVTPPSLPEGLVNCIEVSPHKPGTAYVAYNRYKFNDFTPHILITHDFGQNWSDLAQGIEDNAHVRVVREDPIRPGLLYAGTETGLFLSYDTGAHWDRFQLNLPIVPVTDLKVHHNDLIAATAGRAFWILDDLTPLQKWEDEKMSKPDLFKPATVYLWGGPRLDTLNDMGTNPDYGLAAFYNLPEIDPDREIRFIISDVNGDEVKVFSTKEKEATKKLKVKRAGINKLVWNLVPDGVEPIKGLVTLGGNKSPRVASGNYKLDMIYDGDTIRAEFRISDDPRLEIPAFAFAQKKDWLERLDLAAKDLTESVKAMNYVKTQIDELNKRLATSPDSTLLKQGKSIIAKIDSLKSELVQEKQKTFQDVINFPNQLDAKIRHIQSLIEESYPPVTTGQTTRATDVMEEWKIKKDIWLRLQSIDIHQFNLSIDQSDIPFISTKIPDKKEGKP
ncbi:MAG: hypothetical protein IPL46_12650 [Saprospiraceae bacterium]|nr:hypothetical protein [Saprospiraceae bacterium]